MTHLEELSMNAVPALQTMLFDGWVIRMSDGFTKRANSVNPVYDSREDLDRKIRYCEDLFQDNHLRPTYKITPFTSPGNLDAVLAQRGYRSLDMTSVQTRPLEDLPDPALRTVVFETSYSPIWLAQYCEFNRIGMDHRQTYARMLKNLIPQALYATLYHGGEPVGVGLAVLENGYMGLFDITIAEPHRDCGLGRQMMLHLLHAGRAQGARHAYLQVVLGNGPALRLYASLGFHEAYRYHYRVQ